MRRFFERIFEQVDNPLGWSLALFRLRGILVRIHIFTLVYMVGEIVRSISASAVGWIWASMFMGWLFVLVLLHEFGHAFTCRAVGGEADRIVMAPFGGLAMVQPPHEWRASLLTVIGGPMVNVALAPVFALALLVTGLGGTIVFNPFEPGVVLGDPAFGAGVEYWLKTAVWTGHYINLVLLGFNVLLPFFPLDGGRIVQCVLWRSKGYVKATETAVLIGFGGAVLLIFIGMWTRNFILMFIGIFGLWACWVERQRVRADVELAEAGAFGGIGGGFGADPGIERGGAWELEEEKPSRSEMKREERERRDAELLDSLLEKIASVGMGGLTRSERKALDRLSKEKRKSQGRPKRCSEDGGSGGYLSE